MSGWLRSAAQMRALYLEIIITIMIIIKILIIIMIIITDEGAVPVLVGLVHVRLGMLQQLLHHLKMGGNV